MRLHKDGAVVSQADAMFSPTAGGLQRNALQVRIKRPSRRTGDQSPYVPTAKQRVWNTTQAGREGWRRFLQEDLG